MYDRFGLTLVVNHACNLRCTYCYTGEKLGRRLPTATGRKAIDRALRSINARGSLELAFFGGEPLVEAELILELIDYARRKAAHLEIEVSLSMTTNGAFDSPTAWAVMLRTDMQLAVSHDGLPEVHDRHRVTLDGRPSSLRVNETIARLLDEEKNFRVVMVVRPDSVELLPAGVESLYELGVRRFDPSLDLWTVWTRSDGQRLREAIRQLANFWSAHLPECGISWFDEKTAHLARIPLLETARCGFGVGEVAVTPAGNLYPCERLIGADKPDNPMRLPGDVMHGNDFLDYRLPSSELSSECAQCALQSLCSTFCRCSNYVRTGDTDRPDGLLCLWDQACNYETIRALRARTFVNN